MEGPYMNLIYPMLLSSTKDNSNWKLWCLQEFTRTLRFEISTCLKILANVCNFWWFSYKMTNMIIKIQSVTYINAQKLNPGFTSRFNIGYLDVNRSLLIRWHLSALDFKKFSENQSNILCIPFQSFSEIAIM